MQEDKKIDMNQSKQPIFLNISKYLLIITLLLTASSCGEDRRTEYKDRTDINDWIEVEMRDKYLWYEDIPDASKLNPYQMPEFFFSSLLSDKDGKKGRKYSTIERLSENTRSSYNGGIAKHSNEFQFILYKNEEKTQTFTARILYVVPNTSAEKAGLKRGDWVLKINDAPITLKSAEVLRGSESLNLLVGRMIAEETIISQELHLPAPEALHENPVMLIDKFQVNGEEIGYLVYNSFKDGYKEDSQEFNDALRAASHKLKGVRKLILDLRYNGGGTLSSATLLGTLLAPQKEIQNKALFCYLEGNDKQRPRRMDFNFEMKLLQSGVNLDLEELYVLTSEYTASASELIINSLKPYQKVIVIGNTTEGKNVAARSIKDPSKTWQINPIFSKVYNVEEQSDYEKGITPHFQLDAESIENFEFYLPLGDTNELLLSKALDIIREKEQSRTPESGQTRSISPYRKLTPVYNSLDEKSSILSVEE